MNINVLKAGTGDAILIQNGSTNIVIDGGDDSTHLVRQIDMIYDNKGVIDLVIVTHHDDDHIRGIIELIEHAERMQYSKKNPFIKKIIFNSPGKIRKEFPEEEKKYLSYRQASELESLISKYGIAHDICTDEHAPIVFEDISIEFLSPSKEDLEEYSMKPGAYLTGDWRCDWESTLNDLYKHIDDKCVDLSVANRSSIVINLKTDQKSFLFTGDITPDRLAHVVDQMYEANGNKPVLFDLVKLPHHGSYKNITEEILKKIKCNNFVVSANGNKCSLPNKRALLKVIKHVNRVDKKQLKFMFNYEEVVAKLNISKKEKRDYNFVLEANNEVYGIHIK